MTETFDVHITFKDGTVMKEPGKGMKELESALARLVKGPASHFVTEVLVTDQMDFAVFHSKDGAIIFPTPNDIKEA